MIIEIPDELVGRALDAVGLSVTGARDGIVRTTLSPGCMDCKTKPTFTIDGALYCSKHALEHIEQRQNQARSLI
jgi:hypothetical protein